MGFSIEVNVPVGGAMVRYAFTASTKEDAQTVATFLAGGGCGVVKPVEEKKAGKSAAVGASKVSSQVAADGATTVTSSAGEKGNAQQAASSTPKSSPASAPTGESSSPAATPAKQYTRDQVAALVTELVKAAKKEKAVAILERHGLKVLPKDFNDVDVLASMGTMAEQTLAGEYDPLAAELPEGAEA